MSIGRAHRARNSVKTVTEYKAEYERRLAGMAEAQEERKRIENAVEEGKEPRDRLGQHQD